MLQFDLNRAHGTRGGRTDPNMSYKSPASFEASHSLQTSGQGGSTLSPEATSASPVGSREFGDSGFLSASYQLSPTQVSQSHSFPMRAFILA